MKPLSKLKPLTRIEYVTLAKSTDPGDLSYPKGPRETLLELRDRGYAAEDGWNHVVKQCHDLKLIPNAYILYDHEIDAIAEYCDDNRLFGDDLIGCLHLDLNFQSYKKSEREMRLLGVEARQAVILAMPRIKGGRRITMMSTRAKAKSKRYTARGSRSTTKRMIVVFKSLLSENLILETNSQVS